MERQDNQDRFIEDARIRQSNTLWPDAMINSSSVDALLWKGSPKATKVQRVGIAIFGLTFALLGVIFELIASQKHKLFDALLGLLFLALGIKLLLNAFKRQPKIVNAKQSSID